MSAILKSWYNGCVGHNELSELKFAGRLGNCCHAFHVNEYKHRQGGFFLQRVILCARKRPVSVRILSKKL